MSLDQLGGAQAALVGTSRFPRLTPDLTTLSADDLAREAGDPEIAGALADDGFVGAVKRELRGRARDITGVDSRVLVFDNPDGVKAFLGDVADQPDPYFGGPAVVRPLQVDGAKGVLIRPPMCACPGAEPVYVGLVADGDRLLWVQITGPKASAATVRSLLSDSIGASR